MSLSIGFIGAGNMGRPFIRALVDQGFSVTVHDIDEHCAQWVTGAGAHWAGSPAQAALDSDVLITCLPLPCHVLAMMTGAQGALTALRAGAVWVDTSTTDYHNTLAIAEQAARRGVLSLEAPVSNLSHMGVDFNNVCFYVGGPEAAYQLALPVLRAMGRKVLHVGQIGQGQSVKLLTNLLFYCAALTWGELLMVARTHGIDLHWLWDKAKGSRGNCFVVDQVTPLLLDGSYDHSCTLEITVKDTALTVALADELGIPMPLGRAVEQRFRRAGQHFAAQANHMRVVNLLEQEHGRSLQVQGFFAPSPYGANPEYRHSGEWLDDDFGRIKPKLPEGFRYPLSHPAWARQASCLNEVMARSNYLILQEALQLGEAMNLDPIVLTHVVRWSCGPSWVSDNLQRYSPDERLLNEFADLAAGLRLPLLQAILPDGGGIAPAAQMSSMEWAP